MRETCESLMKLSDDALIARVRACVSDERGATARLLACLGEVDRRRLYLPQGYSSLFAFCTQHLRLSERSAYSRIEAARLVRRFPVVLEMIADGRVSLTVVSLLARHLTEENHRALLARAAHRTTREVEGIVAALRPLAVPAPVSVRRLPVAKPVVVAREVPAPLLAGVPAETPAADHASAASALAPCLPERPALGEGELGAGALDAGALDAGALGEGELGAGALDAGARDAGALDDGGALAGPPSEIAAGTSMDGRVRATEACYSLRVTISKNAHDELMRARDLLRHLVPSGDLGRVLERAISALVRELEKKKLAYVSRPRAGPTGARTDTRNIPAAVRREVWRRDRARCAFVGPAGRCAERGFLELHHVRPFAAGGQATASNIELRCRAHNAHEAQVYFGAARSP